MKSESFGASVVGAGQAGPAIGARCSKESMSSGGPISSSQTPESAEAPHPLP